MKMYGNFSWQWNLMMKPELLQIFPKEGKEDAMSTLLNTNVYDYIRVLDKAADASWIRNDCISNNMANVNTPGYKRQDVDFKGQLK